MYLYLLNNNEDNDENYRSGMETFPNNLNSIYYKRHVLIYHYPFLMTFFDEWIRILF